MKKSNILLIGGAVLVLIVIFGGLFILLRGGKGEEEFVPVETKKVSAKEITPEEIGLTLTPISNNQKIRIEIAKVDGISSFEYELSYDATENGETVPRGAIGELEVVGGKKVSHDIDLGSCSSGTCKYDKGVTEVSAVVRVNYTDGQTAVAEMSVSLE